jgi:hypothetical protein
VEEEVFEVWHLKDPKVRSAVRGESVLFPFDYELVAKVTAFDMEAAVKLTASEEGPWWQDPGVECVKKARSTQLFDIVRDSKGNGYMVSDEGLSQVWSREHEVERSWVH